jgi:hypothetical protein
VEWERRAGWTKIGFWRPHAKMPSLSRALGQRQHHPIQSVLDWYLIMPLTTGTSGRHAPWPYLSLAPLWPLPAANIGYKQRQCSHAGPGRRPQDALIPGQSLRSAMASCCIFGALAVWGVIGWRQRARRDRLLLRILPLFHDRRECGGRADDEVHAEDEQQDGTAFTDSICSEGRRQ